MKLMLLHGTADSEFFEGPGLRWHHEEKCACAHGSQGFGRDRSMRVQSFDAVLEKPVTRRQSLGNIPADQYVLDRPFVPSAIDPAPTEWLDIQADVPVRDPELQIQEETVTLTEAAYSPGLRALACGALGGAIAATIAQGSGSGAALVAGIVGAGVSAVIGAASAAGDQLELAYEQRPVFEPKLAGYTHHTLDGAFVHDKPVHWFQDRGGTLHYYLPSIEETEVGTVQVPVVRHQGASPELAALSSGLVGLGAGIAPLLAAI